MDINTLRGIVTALLLVLFLWLIAWAWSRQRTAAFDAAARLPLEDDKEEDREDEDTP